MLQSFSHVQVHMGYILNSVCKYILILVTFASTLFTNTFFLILSSYY